MGIVLNAAASLRGWSQLSDAVVCPQKWLLKHALRVRGDRPSQALVQGSLVHVACAQHYARRQAVQDGLDPDVYANALDAMKVTAAELDAPWAATAYSSFARDLVPESYQIASGFLSEDPFRRYRILAVETPIELWCAGGDIVDAPEDAEERREMLRANDQGGFLAMGTPWLHTARLDLVVETGGLVYMVDHKTGYKWDDKKIAGYAMTGALHGAMLWGGREYGDRFGGLIVSGIDKARGGKPHVFMPPIGADSLRNFAWVVHDANERLRTLNESGRPLSQWPRALSEQGPCVDRYDVCQVMNTCARGGYHGG